MNVQLGLRVLGSIMKWEEDEAMKEFRWLLFISSYKYDGYSDFLAGYRFLESLANWLQQFNDIDERRIAYDFVKNNLIYYSAAEIHHLVDQFYPEYVQPDLIRNISQSLKIPTYKVWATEKNQKLYENERRKTLFMGLSDGARIDTLRRMNSGLISNEQFVIATEINRQKWASLLNDLREDLKNDNASFSRLYLIDDFTASGTSLIRAPENELKGKLKKFSESLSEAKEDLPDIFEDGVEIRVHHYIATEKAVENIEQIYSQYSTYLGERGLKEIEFSWGVILPNDLSITSKSEHPFKAICEKYYDPVLHNKGVHGAQSGIESKMYGYAECGSTIVLEHNTPNNSLPLIWADTAGCNDSSRKPMKPLFRRRERHSDMEQSRNNKKEV